LVYFGLIEDFHEIDTRKRKSFQQVFVLWFKLISSLFTDNECNKEIVDDCVRLFLSSCICYGNSTKKVPNNKGDVNEEKKKLKGHKSEAVFFKDTSNYFSLLNLRSLIERFGLPRILWEGEREKFIKYVKAEMNTIQDTEKYMSGVLNNLL
jgi:hypothetical protein